MNRAEKEHRIKGGSGPFPSFQEIMESARQTRDRRLKLAEDEEERATIEKEYDDKLDRILAEMLQN